MPLYSSTGALNVAVNDTTGTGRYSASGALRINLVTGTSYVGLYAADGSMNVIDVTGVSISTYGGLYHPSGAIRGRTAPTTLSGLQAPDGSYYFLGLFSPLNLFSAGEQGAWYDPSDLSTMFQDSAGTTPVTAVEQPVGLIRDKSGKNNHASQATSTSRPILSARVNLLTYSEQFDNAAWTNNTVTVAANNVTAPDGTLTADRLTATGADSYLRQGINVTSGVNYTLSVYLRADAPTTVSIYCLNPVTAQVCNVTTSWQQFSLVVAPSITGSVNWQIGGGSSFSTGEIIYAWGADLRVTNDGVGIPSYQRVIDATTYDTTGFPLYLRFDGTDDSLSTTSINFSATDKMSVFAGMRKLSDASGFGVPLELGNRSGALAGSFTLHAPGSAGATYWWASEGTVIANLNISSGYAAPITNVITGVGDISGDIARLRINGSVAGTTTTDQGTGNYGNHPLYIGRRNNASLPFSGRLYSIIIRGAQSTATEIVSAETWVNGKTRAY